MAKEIERKFLLKNDDWRPLAKRTLYRQGYLNSTPERSVRIRIVDEDAYLTIKGIATGITRTEYEYKIPYAEGMAMLENLSERPIIEKYRSKISYGGLIWEVDEFLGENQGLILAEVELQSVDQLFEKPSWIGQEVSDDNRYFNVNLIHHPYTSWDK